MINRLLNIALLVICLWAMGSGPALADKIYFNSGRKMEARVLSDEDGKLELALPNGGTMVIDRSTVKRIQKADPSEINVNFVMRTGGLFKFVSTGEIFSAIASNRYAFVIAAPEAQCQQLHVHGPHPCTGAPDPGGPCGHGIVNPYVPGS